MWGKHGAACFYFSQFLIAEEALRMCGGEAPTAKPKPATRLPQIATDVSIQPFSNSFIAHGHQLSPRRVVLYTNVSLCADFSSAACAKVCVGSINR